MAHFYTDIHEARIREVFDRIKHDIVRERAPLQAEVAVTPEPVPYDKRLSLKYRPIKQGEHWGNTWDCAWFHVTGTLPKSWKGAYVTLNLNFDGEALTSTSQAAPSSASQTAASSTATTPRTTTTTSQTPRAARRSTCGST